MKTSFSIFTFLLVSVICFGQLVPYYTYDAAGNRTHRVMDVKAMETPDKFDTEEEEVTDSRTPDEAIVDSGISVYPNPTFGYINIEIPSDKFEKAMDNGDKIILTILDHSGKQVLKKTIQDSNERLDLTNVARGKYVLTLKSNPIAIGSMEQSWQIIKN